MLKEIELMRLRDIAFEYFPQLKANVQANNVRGFSRGDYYVRLFSEATLLVNRNLSAVELSAVRLLQAIALHATYDPDDPEQQAEGVTPQEMYDMTVQRIVKAVNTLSGVAKIMIAPPDEAPLKQVVNNTNPRLEALKGYLTLLEKQARVKNIPFDPLDIPLTKAQLFAELKERYPCFKRIEMRTFSDDWRTATKANICANQRATSKRGETFLKSIYY